VVCHLRGPLYQHISVNFRRSAQNRHERVGRHGDDELSADLRLLYQFSFEESLRRLFHLSRHAGNFGGALELPEIARCLFEAQGSAASSFLGPACIAYRLYRSIIIYGSSQGTAQLFLLELKPGPKISVTER